MANLEALAAETESALRGIWDDLGVPTPERAEYVSRIAEDVAGLYRSRVDCQEARRASCAEEVAGLQSTIENMQHAMVEAGGVVRGSGTCARA